MRVAAVVEAYDAFVTDCCNSSCGRLLFVGVALCNGLSTENMRMRKGKLKAEREYGAFFSAFKRVVLTF